MRQDPFKNALEGDATLEEVLPVTVEEEPDPLAVVNQDDRYDYVWAAIDESHPQSWVAMQSRGWRLVSKAGGSETNPYGKTVYKDLVLMRRPKEIGQRLRRLRLKQSEDALWRSEKQLEKIQEKAETVCGEPITVLK